MKFFTLFIFFFVITIISNAQNLAKQIDSITSAINRKPDDTAKVKELNDAAFNFKTKNADQAKQWGLKSYALASKLNFKSGEIDALDLVGNVMDNQGDYAEAMLNYRKAFLLAEDLKAKKNIAGLLNNIGLIFEHTGMYDSALVYYNHSLLLKNEMGNKRSIASTLNNIGDIYYEQSNYNKALEYLFQSLKIKEELNDKRLMASGYHNIANVYLDMKIFDLASEYELKCISLRSALDDFWGLGVSYNTLGLIYSDEKFYDRAIAVFNKAIGYSVKEGDSINLAKVYSSLSQAYFGKSDFALSEKYELHAIAIKQAHNDFKGLSVSYNHLGNIYLQQGNSIEARRWYELSFATGKKLDNKKAMSESLEGISNTYLKEKRLDSALFFLRQYSDMKDSMIDESRMKEIATLQVKYESKAKQQEIDSLNLEKEKNRSAFLSSEIIVQKKNYLLLAFFLLLVAAGIAFLQFRKNQKIKLASEKATAILETEISERQRIARDMHDELGSSLSKIAIAQRFAKENKTDKKILEENLHYIGKATNELVESMGDLIWCMNNNDNSLDALLARIRSHTSDYLEEAGFEYAIDIPDEFPQKILFKDSRHHLYLTFKEALNNAVKHSGGNLITVNLEIVNGNFKIIISDNGKGFVMNGNLQKGNGLTNMQQRMRSIGGEIIFKSGEMKGTIVELNLHEKKLFSDNPLA